MSMYEQPESVSEQPGRGIIAVAADVEAQVNLLGTALVELTKRLEPVLLPERDDVEPRAELSEVRAERAPFGRELESLRIRVQGLKSETEDLARRLDLPH